MKKREQAFNTKFNHWLKAKKRHVFVFKLVDAGYQNPFDCFSVDKHGKFYAWELKQTQTNSIPFVSVVPHQLSALSAVSGSVVIKYPKFFCIIHVADWLNEIDISNRKSLTSERAKLISTLVVED